MKKLNILLVFWEDISESPGWHMMDSEAPIEEICAPARCFEVGFKIKETKKYLYLAKLVGVDPIGRPQLGSPTVIPKGCIRKVQVLKRINAEVFP